MIICIYIFQSITEQNWPRALIKQANTEQDRRILLTAKVNFITLLKNQNLTNTFKPFLSMLLKCLSPNFFYLINEKYSLEIVELSKDVFVQCCLSYLFCTLKVQNSAYFVKNSIFAVRMTFRKIGSSDVAGVTRASSNL